MAEQPVFTERELDVMSILWRRGSATVAEVRADLAVDLAYTSVLSALQALQAKGFVRPEQAGRAYRYWPTVGAEAAGGSALNRIVEKIFHGSVESLLAQLVTERRIAAPELKRMRRLLEARLREAEGREESHRPQRREEPGRKEQEK